MKSLIIIAHGSRKETSNNEVLEIVNQVKISETNYALVEPAFLEFAHPTLEECVKKSLQKNSFDIFIYPYFLNSGRHVTTDIPDAIQSLEKSYPQIKFTLLPHFGQSLKINQIILSDTNI